jgi:hypothetical protein
MVGKPVRRHHTRKPLTDDERDGIQLAVQSAFRKLKNLYARIVPIFQDFGFTPPAPGVIARDLSEKIEKAIIQHCESFTKGNGHCDLWVPEILATFFRKFWPLRPRDLTPHSVLRQGWCEAF